MDCSAKPQSGERVAKDKDNVASFIDQAQAAMNQQKHQEARAIFLRALEVRPDLPDAHYGLATVCFLQGDVLGAAHHFKEVTRHDPLRAGAFVNLGALYNHLGREEDAIVALRRGIQLDPHRAEGYYNLGLVYRRIGQPAQAIEAYREAVRIQPDLGDAHINLANLYLDEDELESAIVHYHAALKVRPGWHEAEQGLAIAKEALEDDIEALQEATPELPPLKSKPRSLDPALHSVILAEIHKASVEADALAKSFVADVARQLETSLKDLSACLLRADCPEHELVKNIEAFDVVVDRVKGVRSHFVKLHDHIQTSGEDLKRE